MCTIIGYPAETKYYWQNQRHLQCLMNHLKTIEMGVIDLSSENAIEFLKFLLMNSPVLIRMRLVYKEPFRCERKEKAAITDLLLFKRASPNALLEIKHAGMNVIF